MQCLKVHNMSSVHPSLWFLAFWNKGRGSLECVPQVHISANLVGFGLFYQMDTCFTKLMLILCDGFLVINNFCKTNRWLSFLSWLLYVERSYLFSSLLSLCTKILLKLNERRRLFPHQLAKCSQNSSDYSEALYNRSKEIGVNPLKLFKIHITSHATNRASYSGYRPTSYSFSCWWLGRCSRVHSTYGASRLKYFWCGCSHWRGSSRYARDFCAWSWRVRIFLWAGHLPSLATKCWPGSPFWRSCVLWLHY